MMPGPEDESDDGRRADRPPVTAGPDQAIADLIAEHAATGWRDGWQWVDQAEAGAEPDRGLLDTAIRHLETAVLDGVAGFTATDPDLHFLLGHLLIGSAEGQQNLDSIDRANLAFAAGLARPGLDDEMYLALLDGALLACMYRVALLERDADTYQPAPELTTVRDELVTAADALWLAVPDDHPAADAATVAYMRALAARLIGDPSAESDRRELTRLVWARPDLRATEGTDEATALAMAVSQALMVAFEHDGAEESLLAVADLVTEARSWPDLPLEFAPVFALALASVIVNSPEETALAARLVEARALMDEAAAALPPDSPYRPQIDIQRAILLHRVAAGDRDGATIEEAAQEINRVMLRSPDERIVPADATLASLLGGVLDTRFRRRQDLRDVRAGLQLTERAIAGFSGSPTQRAVLQANQGVQLVRMAWVTGDADAAADGVEALRKALVGAPASGPLRYQLYATLAGALMTRAEAETGAQRHVTLNEAWNLVVVAAEEQPPKTQTLVIQVTLAMALGDADPQIRLAGERAAQILRESRSRLAGQERPTGLADLASAMLQAAQALRPGDDVAMLDAAILQIDEQARDPAHPAVVSQMLTMQQARMLRRRDDLEWRRSAQSAANQPASQDVRIQQLTQWLRQGGSDASEIGQFVADHLIEQARDSSDRRRSRELGLDVLRGHALRVLLQSGAHDAISIARAASADAHEVVTWCLADGADDEAVLALETGRGLTVLAAGATGSVGERLEAIGEPALARAWRQSHEGGTWEPDGRPGVPSDVRYRALDRLAASGDLAGLLRPSDRETLAATLRHLGYDALIYLIPEGRSLAGLSAGTQPGRGNVGRPGGALMVTAGSQLRWESLPGLVVGPDSVVSNYLSVHRALLTEGGRPADRGAWRQALESVCQWAWTAVMGPLQPLVAHIHTDRRARVVLVPVDALSVIPWHAAYPADDQQRPYDERRYALDSATFSYAASGTLLSRIAHRSPPAVGPAALLVGDPGGDLPYAQLETQALRDAFYPDATIWGEPPSRTDGAATPARVRDALTGQQHSLFHYAGHATVDTTRPGSSALVMGDQRLRADRISRLIPQQNYCVCLAACTTHLTTEALDEAFTLSTAFLLGGASTVLGSLWRIKDAGTAVLTFMVHYYLSRGHRPADALHRAQLWMLNRSRRIPDSMPAAMRAALPGLDLTDPVAWAALTHQGH